MRYARALRKRLQELERNSSVTGIATADLCRQHGISHATFYNWRAKYGRLDVSETQRLKQLEDENRKLKRIVADQALDLVMLKDLISKIVEPEAHAAVWSQIAVDGKGQAGFVRFAVDLEPRFLRAAGLVTQVRRGGKGRLRPPLGGFLS